MVTTIHNHITVVIQHFYLNSDDWHLCHDTYWIIISMHKASPKTMWKNTFSLILLANKLNVKRKYRTVIMMNPLPMNVNFIKTSNQTSSNGNDFKAALNVSNLNSSGNNKKSNWSKNAKGRVQ